MARFNSTNLTTTTTGAVNLLSPSAGLFTTLTGTAPYTVTIGEPRSFVGESQTFYNATSGTVNLATPSGNFIGPGSSGASTQAVPAGATFTIFSSGTNYVLSNVEGGPVVGTTGSFSGNVTMNVTGTVSITPSSTLTINPTVSSTMDNVVIGGTTRQSANFTTLAANSAVTFTQGVNSSSISTGTLQVTGGVGITQNAWIGGLVRITDSTASTSTSSGALVVTGGLGVGGAINAVTKSFIIEHPTKPGMKLRYGSLEGPENGVYLRGRLTNEHHIQFPDYWSALVDIDTVTVTLTPIKNSHMPGVGDITDSGVNILGDNIDCFYLIMAERKDVEKLVVEY